MYIDQHTSLIVVYDKISILYWFGIQINVKKLLRSLFRMLLMLYPNPLVGGPMLVMLVRNPFFSEPMLLMMRESPVWEILFY
jgi:hypothetical protein